MNLDKFTIKASEALQKAVRKAQQMGQQAVEPEHLYWGIQEEGDNVLGFVYGKLGVNGEADRAGGRGEPRDRRHGRPAHLEGPVPDLQEERRNMIE